MKRIATLCAVIVCVAFTIGCKPKADSIVPREGLINFVTGDVKLVSEQGQEADAKIGDAIKEGMKITTKGPKSSVDIFFGENAIKVLGNSSIDVKKLILNATRNSEQTELFVNNGAVFSKVTKLSKTDDYRVKSPTATAGVRGTDFILEEREGKANVACLDGKVEAVNNTVQNAQPVVLDRHEEVDIQSGQSDMVKKQISQDRLNMLNIKLTIQQMREDIRQRYLQQKEEMQKILDDQRQRNRQMVQDQKDADRKRVEDQKALDRANVDAIKGEAKARQDESTAAARAVMDKSRDTSAAQNVTSGSKSQVDAIKSSNKPTTANPLEQFKQQQQKQ